MRTTPRSRTTAHIRRIVAVVTAAAANVLALGVLAPAWARQPEDGEVLAAPLPLGSAALIYVGIPLAIIGGIWLLASIPSMVSSPRYRPGLSWWASPVWFEGPAASSGSTVGADGAGSEAGGTSARW